MIVKHTAGRFRLDDVLRRLYQETYKKGKGYSKQLYQDLLQEISGLSFEDYFFDLIDGKGKWDEYVQKMLEAIGLELIVTNDGDGLSVCKVQKCSNLTPNQKVCFEMWVKKC
jgi:predicted metalloprotease with PDZ domain